MSPKARRLAREHGVDVTRLRGSGPGGEVLAEDILKAAQGAGAASASAGALAACRRRLLQQPQNRRRAERASRWERSGG